MHRRNKNLYIISLVFLVGLTLVFGSVFGSSRVFAESAGASVVVPANYCNITTDTTNDIPHTATINAGTYQADIGTTTFKVVCGDTGGFSVYAIGYANDEMGNNKLLATINGTLAPSYDIVTGTATSGSNSNWAMKLTSVAGTFAPTLENGYGNYSAVPTTNTKVATFPSVTDEYAGSSFKATYSAYINQMQPAGSYNGKVKYTMVHPASVVPTNFNDAYAAAGKTKLNGYYKMQDMDASICDAVNFFDEASQTQLIDARDNKLYYVAKLKDGGCWMTQNLDHNISTSFAYTPDNTDIPANWTPDKSTYTGSTTTWDTSTNGYNIQQSYDPGDKIWDGTPSSSTSITINNMTQGTNQHYHLGNYYNWGAAVAMNNTSSYTTQNQDVNQSICPKGWMLPKSGTTNTSAGSFQYLVNQYNWASNSMTNPNMWASPLYFPLAGTWYGSSNDVAYDGLFWSSMVNSSSNAYPLIGNYSGYVYPARYANRGDGFSVRCVAREAGSTPGYVPTDLSDSGMTTMQQMTPKICAATAEGTEKQLRDERDNKTYWVAKLKDGKCWMTQNLDHDIDSTKTYTSNDTDVPSNWKPDKSTYPTSTTTWDTSSTGYNIQQSYDPGDKIWDGVTVSSNSVNINNMTQGTNQHYHLGNYYNWGAAVAMNNTSTYTTNNIDVNQSICPKGWMLPKSGNNTSAGSFQYLVNQYNWASNSMTNPNMWATPLYFPLAGNWDGSSYYVAYYGYFWSSMVNSSSNAYRMYGYYSGTVYPANNRNRYLGFSVRCVSR